MIQTDAFRDLEKNQNNHDASKPDPTNIVFKSHIMHVCLYLFKYIVAHQIPQEFYFIIGYYCSLEKENTGWN